MSTDQGNTGSIAAERLERIEPSPRPDVFAVIVRHRHNAPFLLGVFTDLDRARDEAWRHYRREYGMDDVKVEIEAVKLDTIVGGHARIGGVSLFVRNALEWRVPDEPPFEPCGRGVCCMEDGHEGACQS